MSNRLYDPWDDAALLAAKGASAQYRLVIVLGAQWCHKCQEFKKIFEHAVPDAAPHYLPVWLDIEEHADFLDGYLPENLPELLVYRAGKLVQRTFLEDASQFNACLHAPEQQFPESSSPRIADLLIKHDWCHEGF